MSIFLFGFLLSFIAGISTLLGILIIFIKFKDQNKIIRYSMLFSSFVMIYVSLFDLIPSSFLYISKIYEFIPSIMLIIIYMIFGGLLIYSISSHNNCNNRLLKIGILSFFTLVIHNIPEGIITFISSYKDISLGLSLTTSIALHNIPEGIIIAVSIYYSTQSKLKAFLFTLVAALSEPFGSLLAFLFIVNINDYLFGIILALTAGIMLYLSIFEIVKENKKMLI